MLTTKSAIRAVEDTIAASAALRENLRRGESIGRRMISALEQGTPISETFDVVDECPSELRQMSHDCLADYEASRHRMRAVFMVASLDEGCSIGDIGRKLGVSRQLASRLLREAREAL